jgi:hypothetical protein
MYVVSSSIRSVKDNKRRTMLNLRSKCLGEESSEGNERGNGELHDFDG